VSILAQTANSRRQGDMEDASIRNED